MTAQRPVFHKLRGDAQLFDLVTEPRLYTALRGPLPVATLPDVVRIEQIVQTLSDEFPWAFEAVEELACDLRSRRLFGGVQLGTPPTLLVGPPGCGKSRLVRRLGEELRLPFMPLSLAGKSDSRALLGTARGWASAQASPLVDLLLAHKSASALVLVDEIDKVLSSTPSRVPPTVALLNLLEPENAKQLVRQLSSDTMRSQQDDVLGNGEHVEPIVEAAAVPISDRLCA